MSNAFIHVGHFQIDEINNGVIRPSSSTPVQDSVATDPIEFKKSKSVEVELKAGFQLISDSKKPHVERFHFEVRDAHGKEVANCTVGHCSKWIPIPGVVPGALMPFFVPLCIKMEWKNELVFSKIKFDKTGVHNLTMLQTTEDSKHYSTDARVYRIRITVSSLDKAPTIEYFDGKPNFINTEIKK